MLAAAASSSSLTQNPQSIERRVERRYPTGTVAEVEILQGGSQYVAGFVLDVSRSGLRLELRAMIQKGTLVRVRLDSGFLVVGEVRYCRASAEGFHAGILIREAFQSGQKCSGHIAEDDMGLYLIGQGLTPKEVIAARVHLNDCADCRSRMHKIDEALHLARCVEA